MTFPFYDYDSDFFSTEDLLFLAGASGKAVEDTATGNPLTFTTDIAKPLRSLLVPFTPQQEGTGDPSPQNIRSILPWDGLNVGRINGTAPVISNNAGMENVNGEWKNTGTDTKTRFDAYIQLYKNGTYIKNAGFKAIAEAGIYSMTFVIDDENCNRIVLLHSGSQTNLSIRFPFDNTQGTYTINFNVVSANPSVVGGLTIKDIFLVEGSTVDRTETDISFPSPVYGGSLDVVSGVLTVEWIAHTFDGTEQFLLNGSFTGGVRFLSQQLSGLTTAKSAYSDMLATLTGTFTTITKLGFKIGSPPYQVEFYVPTDSIVEGDATTDDFKHWLSENNVTIVAPLATPTEQTLTGHQLTALVGDNTIWSDADGSMTAVYLKKG